MEDFVVVVDNRAEDDAYPTPFKDEDDNAVPRRMKGVEYLNILPLLNIVSAFLLSFSYTGLSVRLRKLESWSHTYPNGKVR